MTLLLSDALKCVLTTFEPMGYIYVSLMLITLFTAIILLIRGKT